MSKSIKIFVRLESNKNIGVGHLMRQLIFCDILFGHNIDIEFISCDPEDLSFKKTLQNREYNIISSRSNFKIDNESKVPQEDAYNTLNIIKADRAKTKILIIDFYQIDYKWEELVRPHVNLLIVVDDLANRKHSCDILIDPSCVFNINSYERFVNKDAKLYLGPKYIFFNKQILKLKRTYSENKNIVLVFFGGADYYNETYRVLNALSTSNIFHNYIFEVYVGLNNINKNSIKALSENFENIKVFDFSSNFHKSISRCEISVGTGGMAMWERCYFGIPSVVTSTGVGQRKIMNALHKHSCINYIGESNNVGDDVWVNSFQNTIRNKKFQVLLRNNSRNLVKDNLFLNKDREYILNYFGLNKYL